MGVYVLVKCRVLSLQLAVSRHFHLQITDMVKMRLPERWTDYTPVGKRIPGTRFIAFKVPLTTIYDNKLAPWQRFSPSDLIKEVEKQNEELGLVVDLTCTKRYYNPAEFSGKVAYSKIFTIGQEVPSNRVITEFKSTVKRYLSQNSENDKLVGVHCTHGLNRTGYLVCRYLIDVLRMDPSEAIEKFNSSRGHSIERNNYLDDLLKVKSKSKDESETSNEGNNSLPPPHPVEQPKSHGDAGFKNHEHFSKKDAYSGPPRYQGQHPNHGDAGFKNHKHFSKKEAYSGPPPYQVQHPNHGYHNPNARRGNWGSGPQRGHSHYGGQSNGYHQRPQRTQHVRFDDMDDAPFQHHRPHFSDQSDYSANHSTPYQRHPKKGSKKKPKKQGR